MDDLRLGSRIIGRDTRPYIIAEIGVNHGGSMEQAKRLIELAKEGGADCAKFQTYKADTLASRHSPAYWDTSKEPTLSQHELFKKYDSFGPDEYCVLAQHCARVGIDFLSTPFDDAAIEFLDPLVSFYKIASADLTNIPFLRKVAAKHKPVALSTGACTLAEIDAAVFTLRQSGCDDIVLLHCILNYPTDNADAHLRMIRGLARAYPELLIGYSDHTLPDEAMSSLMTAHLLGAMVIEKHFTLSRQLEGPDHSFALEPEEFIKMVRFIREAEQGLGLPIKKHVEGVENLRLHKKSLAAKTDIAKGSQLEESMIMCLRTSGGIDPRELSELLIRSPNRDIKKFEVLKWDIFKK